ncbi:MAG: hypothetical protein ACOCUT_01130 [bacterium]
MRDTKYLICDCVGSPELEIITNESSGGTNGFVKFKGKFQEANVENKNKRVYSYDLLERERGRLTPVLKERRLFGELDHPADSIIHLENASHLITNLWWEGNCLLGEGEILDTPAGKILESIIRSGIPVGISSRGVGTGRKNSNGVMEIDESYRLITFDVVADPSTPGAFGSKMSEHNQFYKFSQAQDIANIKKSEKTNESIINNTSQNIQSETVISFIKEIFEENLRS